MRHRLFLLFLARALALLLLPGFCLSQSLSYTGCNGQPASGLLQLTLVSENSATGLVQINGLDSRGPSTPFTWSWGDGTTTQGFFPQTHTYQSAQQNDTLQVTSHENDGSTDCAQLLIAFQGQPSTGGSGVAQVAVESAASYQQIIAPGSLASLFGAGLAPSLQLATLTANGTYPKQLGNLSVTVGGAGADLIMVSPTQINFVVPAVAQYGSLNVVVADGLQTIATGTVTVAPTAPALFTTDSSGKGFGAILNAVNFTPAPFTLQTTTQTGGEINTIVAVYGTGFRFAGGTPISASPGDVSPHVVALLSSSTGNTWQLPVLYAGPAPGYEGLDQINVQLTPDVDTSRDLVLSLQADAVPSHPVYLLLSSQTSPTVTGLSPSQASPGALVTITGNGFLDPSRFRASSREYALFILGNGTQLPVPFAAMTAQSAEVAVPVVPIDSNGDLYYGSAQLCIVVDAQRSCASFSLVSPPPTGMPTGAALTQFAQDLVDQAAAVLPPGTDPGIVAFFIATAQAKVDNLRQLIASALAGTPQTIQVPALNGGTVSVVVDLRAIQRMEALLTAPTGAGFPSSLTAPTGAGSSSLRHALATVRLAAAAANAPCTSTESCQANAKVTYDALVEAENDISGAGVIALITFAAVGCVLDIETGCLPGAIAGVAAESSVIQPLLDVSDFALIGAQTIYALQPIFLQSIAVNPSIVTLSSSSPSANFGLSGTAVPKYASLQQALAAIAPQIADFLVTSALHTPDCSLCQQIVNFSGDTYATLFSTLTGFVADSITKNVSELNQMLPTPAGSAKVNLGSASLWFNIGEPPFAIQVSLPTSPCPATPTQCPGTVTLINGTLSQQQSVGFTANGSNILLYDDSAPPQTSLPVNISTVPPTIQTNKSSYFLTDVIQVNGSGFSPNIQLNLSLGGIATLPPSAVSGSSGSFGQPVLIPAGTAPGSYTLAARSVSGTESASASITVVAAPQAQFTMSAAGTVVSNGQVLGAVVAPNGSITVGLDGSGSKPAPGAVITTWVWQSNGVTLSCVSASCSITLQAPSNTITLTVTDSTGQTSSATGQINLTITQTPGNFTIVADKSAISIVQGQSGVVNVTVQSVSGFHSSTRLSVSGFPANSSASWSAVDVMPPQNSSATSGLTMSVTGSTSPDTYNLTLQAAAAGYAPQTLPLTLTVLTPTLPSLQLLTINPTAVQAGGPATVTIQLSGPAPPGGAVINLSASGSAFPVLPTFTIAAGATYGSFQTQASSPIPSTTSITITATYNGTGKNASVTVDAGYTLTVSEMGQGTVTSADGQISCVNSSGACSASYATGTTVTLNATAATNWNFSGWSSPAAPSCKGGNTCTLVMNQNLSLAATFTATGYTLTVNSVGQGIVTSTDGKINCTYGSSGSSGTCSANYPSGASVTLNATPASG